MHTKYPLNDDGEYTKIWKKTTVLLIKKLFPGDKQNEDKEQNKLTREKSNLNPELNESNNYEKELKLENGITESVIKSLKRRRKINGKARGPSSINDEL